MLLLYRRSMRYQKAVLIGINETVLVQLYSLRHFHHIRCLGGLPSSETTIQYNTITSIETVMAGSNIFPLVSL